VTGWNDHTRQASWMPVRKRVNGSRQQKTPDNEYPAHNLQEIGLSSVRGSHRMRLVWDGSGLGGREGRTRASFAIPRRRRHAGELPKACCLGRERARRPRGKDSGFVRNPSTVTARRGTPECMLSGTGAGSTAAREGQVVCNPPHGKQGGTPECMLGTGAGR
jgi:hypothetical protein